MLFSFDHTPPECELDSTSTDADAFVAVITGALDRDERHDLPATRATTRPRRLPAVVAAPAAFALVALLSSASVSKC
eukprot:5767233-Prymnesium_polylepis.1